MPANQLSRNQLRARWWFGLLRAAREELRDHSASDLAAALTYRTLFSLAPLLVVALIVFRAFGALDNAGGALASWLIGLLDIPMQDATGNPNPVAHDLHQFILDLTTRAESVQIRSIGLIGLLVLIWAAMRLIITIEKAFNTIYGAPKGRRWITRIPAYWALITLGPLLAWASLRISSQALEAVGTIPWLSGLARTGAVASGVAVTWLMFFLAYRLLPNLRVRGWCAALGALVAALGWETMKWALRWYLSHTVLDSGQLALYGSLALVPLMMFWVYISWLVTLLGLEVSHLLQTVPAAREDWEAALKQRHRNPGQTDADLLLTLAAAAAEAFAQGHKLSLDHLSEHLGESPEVLHTACLRLQEAGILHTCTTEESEHFALHQDPALIPACHILQLAREPDPGQPGAQALRLTHQALREAMQDKTLADLCSQ